MDLAVPKVEKEVPVRYCRVDICWWNTVRRRRFQPVHQVLRGCGTATACCTLKATRRHIARILVRQRFHMIQLKREPFNISFFSFRECCSHCSLHRECTKFKLRLVITHADNSRGSKAFIGVCDSVCVCLCVCDSVCVSVCPQNNLKNEWYRSLQTWYRE